MKTSAAKVQSQKVHSLPLKFYRRSTRTVARELLGKTLYHRREGILTAGVITETEAYLGIDDPACHTYKGRRTTRVQSMYKTGGHSYVYFIYGIHYCFNVVTQTESKPEAVLIRALHPIIGIEEMQKRRRKQGAGMVKQLCSGPGKVCQAMAIDRSTDGLLLNTSELWIGETIPFNDIKTKIEASPRIGIDYAGDAKNWPLRFFIDMKKLEARRPFQIQHSAEL